MAKKKGSKRKQSAIAGTAHQQSIESLCNLTGLGNNSQVSELEGCLAEFDAIQSPTAVVEGAVSTNDSNHPTTTSVPVQDNETVTTDAYASLPCMDVDPSSRDRIKHSTVLQQRLDLWHDALGSSTDSSSTTSIFLPNIRVEMARHLKMSGLSEHLIKSCPGLRMPVFERWIMDSKLLERNERRTTTHKNHLRYDPVIPSAAHIHDEPTQRLMGELMELSSSISQDKAESLCLELCMNAASAVQDVQQLAHRLGWNQNLGGGAISGTSNKQKKKRKTSGAGKVVLERDSKVYTLVYTRGKEMKPFVVKINASHYEKLRHMFNAVHTHASLNNTTVPPPESRIPTTVITHAFHVLVFVMLLRYSSLSGGQQLNDLRGGGMQGAIHGSVFSVLQTTLGCTMECFASPLNAHFPQFCSAFHHDLEWHFGSVGDFFDVSHTRLLQGCHEVNPPFAPGVMNQMSESLESCLEVANIHDRTLTFVVIVPTAKPANETSNKTAMQVSANSSFRRMTTSAHCSQHVVLQAREHGYVEGSQHLRPTRFKESQYDTSVIILQSVKSKETIGSNFETLLRAAFESLHEKEIEERKANDDTDHTQHDGLSKENSIESVTASRKEITPVHKTNDEPLSPQGFNDYQKSDGTTRKSQKKKKKARHKETN
eukprot:scaffold137012_cov55-Attheya_sp.AAC.1